MRAMRTFVSGAALLWLAAGQASAVEFPDKAGVVQVSAPSQNIECTYVAKATPTYTPKDGAPELTCDRANPKYVRVVIGGAKGAITRIDNPGDQPCCGADHILRYGERWSAGPFTCVSEENGLTCKHKNGHGLFLSLKKIRVD